jgi:Transcriptional regulatory protein, C terminal
VSYRRNATCAHANIRCAPQFVKLELGGDLKPLMHFEREGRRICSGLSMLKRGIMAASSKGAISQLGRVYTESELLQGPIVLDGSLVPMASANVPVELRELSRLMPIVVFVPRSTNYERGNSRQPARNAPVMQIDQLSDRSSLTRAAMTQFRCENTEDVAAFGDVAVRFSTMETCRMGQSVALTCKEFKMLEYMIKHPEKVISREELLNQVWGYQCYPSTRTVDTHMLRLRCKLEQDPSQPTHLLTVHGVGYRFLP